MAIVINLLTFILILISLFLVLLVLVQLPKKEAGVGMAFGAGMSEMLLGAGSGNVLTRITKYTVGIFLVLSLVLSVLITSQARRSGLGVTRALEEQARSTRPAAAPAPAPAFQPLAAATNEPAAAQSLTITSQVVTPAPAVPATPAPATPGSN